MKKSFIVLGLLIAMFSCKNLPQHSGKSKTGMDFIGNNTEFQSDILNGWLKLDTKQSKVIEILGEPSSKEEDTFWGAIGTYVQKWKYEKFGLELNMESEKKGGDKKVLMITAFNPCTMTTSKKIGIGSSIEEVKEKYVDKISEELTKENGKKNIIVESIYGGVIFTFENDKVSEIFIGAAAE